MNPYPNLNNNTDPYNTNGNRLNSYVDPNSYSTGPTPTGSYNTNIGQGYPASNNRPPPNYNQPYAPPAGYNDPNNEHYEIYNQGYSGRQKSIVIAVVFIMSMLITGLIILITKRMNQPRYPYY